MTIRNDAGESLYFARELESIIPETKDTLYRGMTSKDNIPVNTRHPAGAKTITWRGYTKMGRAGIISAYGATDIKKAFGSQSRLDTDLTGISGDPLIIVSGSINDNGKSASEVTSGAESLFSYFKGRYKNSETLVIGPQILSAQTPSTALANEALIFAAASAYGYRTASTNGWFTGTGNAGTPTGDGNQDLFIGSDAAHMTAIGHQYFADRVFDAFMS